MHGALSDEPTISPVKAEHSPSSWTDFNESDGIVGMINDVRMRT